MKKLLIGFCCLVFFSACLNLQKKTEEDNSLQEKNDSLAFIKDSIEGAKFIEEPLVPEAADENFIDFLYNFVFDKRLQHSRIIFPLPYYRDSVKTTVQKEEWEYDPLLSNLEVYSLLFDKEEDFELENDTAATSVKLEWIYFKEHKMKRYYFERIKGEWKLEAIDEAQIHEEKPAHEEFYEFYNKFVSDSIFQSERLAHPLKFVTPDPEDEFQILETTLEKGQWFAFRPVLPTEYLINVNYGQRLDPHSRCRIIELKGWGNGFINTLYFKFHQGVWKLVQFDDLSD